MQSKKIKVLISASGTGGHLIPAQMLSDQLQKKNITIFFAAKDLSKKKIFAKEKYLYKDIESAYPNKNIFSFFYKILKGTLQSIFLILKLKPKIVVGFGSYHTFPVILASYILRKKIILFDSNSYLGLTNRVFAKKAKFLALQFEINKKLKNIQLVKMLPWIDIKNIDNFEKITKLKKDKFTILIFGGSQGSEIINKNFIKNLSIFKDKEIQAIHLLGEIKDIVKYKNIYEENNISSYVTDFEKDMFSLYKNSSFVISRSGASTISELIHFEIPSLLIPFSKAKENHQYTNALFMQNQVKGSILLEEKDIESNFIDISKDIFEKNKILFLKENIKKYKSLINTQNRKQLSEIIVDLVNK
ncbi:MAG: UDP-N-acetylglucosamine--N-acetylmuramyl-(pentapeptide) pyrophosphoryl-undecaprenol N-acetylglucosamine transferase [Candidatus Anoxychlamydiales bacterium]|nr:UDP-N-acetylglucosamine--N-acetylmuramyl-(pentapeptide) pyrophosphoryl-undecaprenol N-acetylglucosamine transferase [Candidatus Anoxychlamydiales bacterium]